MWCGQLVLNCIASIRPYVGTDEFKGAIECVWKYEKGQGRLLEQFFKAPNVSIALAMTVHKFRDQRPQIWNPHEWPNCDDAFVRNLHYWPKLQEAFTKIVDTDELFGLLYCVKIFSRGYQLGYFPEINYSNKDEDNPKSIVPQQWYDPFLGKARNLALYYGYKSQDLFLWAGFRSTGLRELLEIPGMFTHREGIALLNCFFRDDYSYAGKKLRELPPLGKDDKEFGPHLRYLKSKFILDRERRGVVKYLLGENSSRGSI